MACDGQEISQIFQSNIGPTRTSAMRKLAAPPSRYALVAPIVQTFQTIGRADMRSTPALAGAVGLAALAFVPGVSAQTAKSESEVAIRKIIVEMTEGFNSHDGKAASRMYAQDARLVTVRGDVMNGPGRNRKRVERNLCDTGEERDPQHEGRNDQADQAERRVCLCRQ
jgi:hypothetical protein